MHHPASAREAGTGEGELRTWKEAVCKGYLEMLKTLRIMMEGANPVSSVLNIIQQTIWRVWDRAAPRRMANL